MSLQWQRTVDVWRLGKEMRQALTCYTQSKRNATIQFPVVILRVIFERLQENEFSVLTYFFLTTYRCSLTLVKNFSGIYFDSMHRHAGGAKVLSMSGYACFFKLSLRTLFPSVNVENS